MKIWFLALSLIGHSLVAAEMRAWTNTEGKSIEASLTEVVTDAQGAVAGAKVRLATGQSFTLQAAQLSAADNDYLKTALANREAEAKAALLANRKAKWLDHWDKAQQESKESGLPILLFMTGSDWCGYCVELKRDVFETKVFQKFADQHLVLMVADFPHGIRQTKSLITQNEKLKAQFPISGYPTIFLVKDGQVIGRAGSTGGASANEYVERLQGQLARR
jgi:protein disulfide-isomerase